ncbi:MAG TPA: hypothetical protein VFE47_01145 [Tepidisphaeraceae bacterium]|jgi:hypothetical protein|nr:hypothetical protein [Tepidisphaeraceae bacterium]
MDTHILQEKFERMGARLKIGAIDRRRWNTAGREISINILKDNKGEYFDVTTDPSRTFRIDALDVRPKDRHLLLMVAAERDSAHPVAGEKQKFLCGHDERSWFVAAVPGANVSNVVTAMEALKPADVRDSQARNKVKAAHRNLRKNRGFVRQGEWFFIPAALHVDRQLVLNDEPLRRGNGGKAHWAEFAFRHGGETVYVNDRHPNGLTIGQFAQMYGNRAAARAGFRIMQRNATVYVKGRISHPDHKTIVLSSWHRVAMNTENLAPAMRHVAFLD